MALSRRPDKYAGGHSKRAPSSRPRSGFILTVVDGLRQGEELFFEQTATIGRVEENEIAIVEPGISRYHARVSRDHGIYLLQDLGSANGTRLNGNKIGEEPEVLRDGDYITCAQTTLRFSTIETHKGPVTAEAVLRDVEALVDVTDNAGRRAPGWIRRHLRLVLLLAVVAVLGIIAWRLFSQQAIDAVLDRSHEPLSYSEEDEFFGAVFGFGQWDRSHPDQVMVDFEYLGGRVLLRYAAWGVDTVGEVAIKLNGEKIGEVPLTLERWIYGLKLVLPRERLKKSSTNRLTFDNVHNPPARDPWEVCYLQILQEAIPPPDPKEALLHFELAKKIWEEREIEPGNAYRALIEFRKARAYLDGLDQRPDFYSDIIDYIDRLDQELTRRFQEGLFSARRAEKVDDDLKKARRLLLRTMRFFQRDDFRHRELKRYLDSLSGT